jgi:serine/threonine-protein kinase
VSACAHDGATLLPDAAFTSADADVSPGTTVGEYKVEGKLGEGGFGAVYSAEHPLIGKRAAIKVLNRQFSSNPQMVARFIEEAKAVNRIRHRNIIDIFSFGTLPDGRQYFVMELLEGMPLDKYLEKKGRLSPEEMVHILRPVARALDAAHAAGIAHRDLKPENIFLGFEPDGSTFPKLLDFGIAKLMGTGSGASKTKTGTPMGTPYFMSPEQCRGTTVDHRTDVYAFGIMCHQLLAGRLPFDGDNVMDLLMKQMATPPPPLSSVSGLPAALDAPILKMLEKSPDDRPGGVGIALESLVQACAGAGFGVTLGPQGTQAFAANAAAAAPAQGYIGTTPASLKHATPAQMQSFEGARTIAAEPPAAAGQTFQGAERDVRAPAKRTPLLVAGGVGVLLLAGVGVFVGAKMGGGGAQPQATQKPAMTSEPSAATATAATTATASATTSATATAPAEVKVTVKCKPEHAAIFLGKEQIGTAPGPVSVKRGTDRVKLTLKADGFQPKDVEVEPTDNVVVEAALVRLGRPQGTGQGTARPHGDLETPF